MPAAKRKPRNAAIHLTEAGAKQAGEAISNSMIHDGAQSAPREVPTYDARIFDRFVKALRELESAIDNLADAGMHVSINTHARPIYSESTGRQFHTRYSLAYKLHKEPPTPDRD